MLKHFIQESYIRLLHHAADFQIILLHPLSRYRSLILAKLMQEQPRPTFYYSFGAEDTNLGAFVTSFWQDINTQVPSFGRRINQYIQLPTKGPSDQMLADFRADLTELSDEAYFLILDNYDMGEQAEDLHIFLERLLWHLPEHCQVILSSRTLPRLSWLALIARHKAIILRDQEIVAYDPYNWEQSEAIARFEVSAFGPDLIHQGGSLIEDWEGHLPRLLFIFNLEYPSVTRTEICNAFWPRLDSDQAVNVFHVTKRRLHKALGVDVLAHQKGFYQISPKLSVHYDVINFTNALVMGRLGAGEEAAEQWQMVRQLYQGPFLQGHKEKWILALRESYEQGYLEAVMKLADHWAKTQREDHALHLLNQTSRDYWFYEPIHLELISRYAQSGRRPESASHYLQLKQKWTEQGLELSPELQILYEDMMA